MFVYASQMPRPGRPDYRGAEVIRRRGCRIIDRSPIHRIASLPVFWMTLALVILYNRFVFRLSVVGRRNLRDVRGKGCFLISNHTLYLDPAIIAHAIAPRRARFSALQKTFSMPYVGTLIRLLGAFPIPEANGLQKLVRPIRELMDEGWFVHFFPEGELAHRSQSPAAFSPGVFFFSQLLDRPIIPITTVLLPITFFGRRLSGRFFRVKAVIGEPIFPASFRTAGRDVRAAVEAMARYAHSVMCDCIGRERMMHFTVTGGGLALPGRGRDQPDSSVARPSNW